MRLLNTLLHGTFVVGQNFRFDLLPRHFYSSIPDYRELRHNTRWKQPASMQGISGSETAAQVAFLRECCAPALGAVAQSKQVHHVACADNGAEGFGRVEADFLFCFVVNKRPAKVIQVGAGVSTSVILQAAALAGYAPEIVCVDPWPTAYLRLLANQGRIRLAIERAQETEIEDLTDLAHGDLLFVDSTHTVKPGSEVNRIILDVLPRLPVGCYVHFHDINFPYDYPPGLMNTVFFWSESSLLRAFLIHNMRCKIAASLSMLHYAEPRELKLLLPSYIPAEMDHGLRLSRDHPFVKHVPSSIYLEMVA
jgi:hypothetical protein